MSFMQLPHVLSRRETKSFKQQMSMWKLLPVLLVFLSMKARCCDQVSVGPAAEPLGRSRAR
jgi:hypothetical protein